MLRPNARHSTAFDSPWHVDTANAILMRYAHAGVVFEEQPSLEGNDGTLVGREPPNRPDGVLPHPTFPKAATFRAISNDLMSHEAVKHRAPGRHFGSLFGRAQVRAAWVALKEE